MNFFEHAIQLMEPLQNAIATANVTARGFQSAEDLRNALRIITMLGGDLRVVDKGKTVRNYIGVSPILQLPSHVSVHFNAQV